MLFNPIIIEGYQSEQMESSGFSIQTIVLPSTTVVYLNRFLFHRKTLLVFASWNYGSCICPIDFDPGVGLATSFALLVGMAEGARMSTIKGDIKFPLR